MIAIALSAVLIAATAEILSGSLTSAMHINERIDRLRDRDFAVDSLAEEVLAAEEIRAVSSDGITIYRIREGKEKHGIITYVSKRGRLDRYADYHIGVPRKKESYGPYGVKNRIWEGSGDIRFVRDQNLLRIRWKDGIEERERIVAARGKYE